MASVAGKLRLAVARGDGIGPEIMSSTIAVLNAVHAPLEYVFVDMGRDTYLAGHNSGISPETRKVVEATRLLLKGPMETPKGTGVKSINVTARKLWSTFANKRVFTTLPGVETVFSKAGISVDLTCWRESIECLYGGIEHMQTRDVAQIRRLITRPGSLQIHRKAFESARIKNAKRVTCVHKANIMKITDGLFLDTFYEVARQFPEIPADDIIVDDLAMKLVTRPDHFDTLVLTNLQGDIMTDLCAGLVGGLGVAPSAILGDEVAIFEAVHGTAPDIAGKNLANPTALLLSTTMMLRHLGMADRAHMIEVGLHRALAAGIRTRDLSQTKGVPAATTTEFTEGIIRHLPEEAKHLPVNIPFDPSARATAATAAHHVQQHEMMSTPRTLPELTTGVDIFVDTEDRPPELAKRVQAAAPPHLRLTMISNRGTQVWPKGSVLTQCVNHYRCRFELDVTKLPASAGAPPPAASADGKPAKATGNEERWLLEGAAEVAKNGVHVCSLEMLKTIDGKRMYTLAQGE